MEEKIEQLFEIHEKSEEWFSAHQKELERKYESKFIAIKNREVLAAEEEIEKLLELIERKGEDINRVFITFIPPKGVAAIL
ncbi:MAG: hypothetical protein J7J17_01945 [Hadesarchaea archaeon]|nr:hypothetical protein [Hadesarchaea archaeon]